MVVLLAISWRDKEESYLVPTVVCEFYAVVRNELMDLAVLVAFTLRMTNEDDHLEMDVNGWFAM